MRTEKAVSEFIHSCEARNLTKGTIAFYRSKLELFAGACPKLPKKPQPVEAFLASIKCSNVHKVNYFTALRAFFGFMAQRYRKSNPMRHLRPPPLPDDNEMATLDAEEEMRLRESASKPRERAMLTLLIDSGIRSSELAGIRWGDDIKTETIVVYGKTRKREVPISEETRRLLFSLPRSSKDDHVFQGHKGPLTRSGIYQIVSHYMREAGISKPKVGAHRLRHAFGRGFLVMGGDLRSLQLIMGHKRITTTQKYAQLTTRDIIRKHHQFTPLRAVHAAAQESFDVDRAVKEAEEILKEGRST